MGNFRSALQPPTHHVYCRCRQPATYRCELQIPDPQYYFGEQNPERIRKNNPNLEAEKLQVLVDLRNYVSSITSRGVDSVIHWKACDKCITDQIKPYFTHIPGGWDEQHKYHINYEPVIMLH